VQGIPAGAVAVQWPGIPVARLHAALHRHSERAWAVFRKQIPEMLFFIYDMLYLFVG